VVVACISARQIGSVRIHETSADGDGRQLMLLSDPTPEQEMPASLPLLIALASLLLTAAQNSPEAAIRAARTRFNVAIAAHDTVTLDRDWADDITVIASRGTISSGRAAYRAGLIGDFRTRPDVVYRRVPVTIRVHPALSLATEEGNWTGFWTDNQGKVEAGGRYIAQWRLVGGRWLLHAEAFGLLRATR
jgi:ketosteroid isomerase-like protein